MKLRLLAHGKYQVYAVCSDRGDCHLLSFLSELEGVLQAQADRMVHLLEKVAQTGPPKRYEVNHPIQGKVQEFLHGRIRVLWFWGDVDKETSEIVVCTHGYMKASQKTPRIQIDRAEKLCRKYFKDMGKGDIEILPDQGF